MSQSKMNIAIIILLIILTSETGLIIYKLYIPKTKVPSLFEFEPSRHGKDVYNDLKNINCRIYEGSVKGDIFRIYSYNGFLSLAQGKIVLIYQDLSIQYSISTNTTSLTEYIHAYVLTDSNIYYFSKYWGLSFAGNVTIQLINERKIPW